MSERGTKQVLGIIAGNGSLPLALIQKCRQDHVPCVVLAIKGQADPSLFPADIQIHWVRLGGVGQIMRLLRRNEVTDLVMIGGVRRPSLLEVFPDWKGWCLAARLGLCRTGDDGLLRGIVNVFESMGIRVRGVHEYLPELLVREGCLTAARPDMHDISDISRGCHVAKLLGLADVGQSVIVQQGLVLSVEGIEGTQKLIERTKQLRRKGKGGVLVKVIKPTQEKRVDLPTIGVKTVEAIAAAGFKGIAIEADNVLVCDPQAVVKAADERQIFVVGIRANTLISPALHEQIKMLSQDKGDLTDFSVRKGK